VAFFFFLRAWLEVGKLIYGAIRAVSFTLAPILLLAASLFARSSCYSRFEPLFLGTRTKKARLIESGACFLMGGLAGVPLTWGDPHSIALMRFHSEYRMGIQVGYTLLWPPGINCVLNLIHVFSLSVS